MLDIGKVFVLGDSYSTFEGFIPDGYAAYYTKNGSGETDVSQANQTWWYQLLDETKSSLLKNCSYSGTTVCNTGYDGKDCSDISFIARFDKLVDENYFKENKPDTFFVFGGTNDSWANSPIGEPKYSDWEQTDLFSVLPAFCYLLHRICKGLPETRIVCIMNAGLKPVIQEGFKQICGKYNVDFIQLEEADKKGGHPTIKGMKQIKEQIMRFLNA